MATLPRLNVSFYCVMQEADASFKNVLATQHHLSVLLAIQLLLICVFLQNKKSGKLNFEKN
jgi:hypothetical protein